MRMLLAKPEAAGLRPYILGWVVKTPWALVVGGDYPFPYIHYDKEIFISSTDSNTGKALRKAGATVFTPAWVGKETQKLAYKTIKSEWGDWGEKKTLEEIISKTKVLGLGKFNILQNQGIVALAGEISLEEKKMYLDYAVIFEKLVSVPLALQTFITDVMVVNMEHAISCLTHRIMEAMVVYLAIDERKVYGILREKTNDFKVEVGYSPLFNNDPLGEEMLTPKAIFGAFHPDLCKSTTDLNLNKLKEELDVETKISKKVMCDYFWGV